MKTYSESKETKNYYFEWIPIFESYKEVEVDDYCESCGQIDGSHTETQGVNLLRFDLKKFKKDSMYYMNKTMRKVFMPKLEDAIFGPSFAERFIGKKI